MEVKSATPASVTSGLLSFVGAIAGAGEPFAGPLLHARQLQQVGGAAALVAIVISVVHISRHLRFNTSREIKRCTLRILLLVPFYALNCFLSLVLSKSRSGWPYLLTAFREFYEAVVLSAFMQLVLTFLGRREDGSMGGPQAVGDAFCAAMRKPSHASIHVLLARIPVIYSPGASFVSAVLLGILQYAVVMVAVLLADISLWLRWGNQLDGLCTGGLCVVKIPFYAKGVSCGWAMYNLIFFYYEAKMCKELRERLQLIHPHNKFFSVKMIIFFTFFQKILIGTILKDWCHLFDIFVGGPENWTAGQVAEGLQSFLLCVEMLIFAVWHVQAYPVDEFNRLDAAASLRAAIAKKSRLDLKAAVQEAVDAGLEAESSPADEMATECRAQLKEAKALLEQLYPEVQFEGQSSDFVLKTSCAATVCITVDTYTRRLCVTSFNDGGITTDETGGLQVILAEIGSMSPKQTLLTQKRRRPTAFEDIKSLVHHLCSPSGQVGFLGTCAMYKDILTLRRLAREQRAAARLLCNQVGKRPSEAEVERAFRAFAYETSNSITKRDLLNLLFSANNGNEAEANAVMESMGLEEDSVVHFNSFKSFVTRSTSPSSACAIVGSGGVDSRTPLLGSDLT